MSDEDIEKVEHREERAGIRTALTASCRTPEVENATLVGWFVVTEWLDGEGKRSLLKNAGDAGDEPLWPWTILGYLSVVRERILDYFRCDD